MTANGPSHRFDPAMCEHAHNYCLLGATNDELADFFGRLAQHHRQLDRRAVTDFGEAVRSGRVVADAQRGARPL